MFDDDLFSSFGKMVSDVPLRLSISTPERNYILTEEPLWSTHSFIKQYLIDDLDPDPELEHTQI
jgi:hypothetical protein